jgi:tetratricopeptide (TPR) repeat protein
MGLNGVINLSVKEKWFGGLNVSVCIIVAAVLLFVVSACDRESSHKQRAGNVSISYNQLIEEIQPIEEIIKNFKRLFLVPSSYGPIFITGTYTGSVPLPEHLTIDQAISAFRKSVIEYPDSYEPYYYLAMAYAKNEHYSDAIDTLKKAIAIDPNSTPYSFLGYVYTISGSLEEAIATLNQTILLSPRYEDYHNLGFVYQTLGRFDEAIDAYRQNEWFNSDLSICNIGYCYMSLGNTEEAIVAYKQSIKKRENSKARLNLGIAYEISGRIDEASRVYNYGIPGNYDALYNLGLCYDAIGNYGEAIRIYNKLIRVKPDFVLAHLSLGMVYIKEGDHASAMKEYNLLKNLAEFGKVPCLSLANQLYDKIQKDG